MNRPILPLRAAMEILATALAYGLLGWVSLQLAMPTRYATPLYPAAGLALGCVLAWGPRAAWGVALGALAMNGALEGGSGPLAARLGVPLVLTAAAVVQALAGAQLVRRFVGQPLVLNEPRDIAAFIGWGAFVACLVGAVVGTATLGAVGRLAPEELLGNAVTWWVGDALGTLVAAPIVLTLIGGAREDWAPRRLSVGLPLAGATLLMAGALVLVSGWDSERTRATFEREAMHASSTVGFQLLEPLRALEAMRGIYLASEDVSGDELRRAANAWLEGVVRPQALGFVERVPRGAVGAFEERVRREGLPAFRVFDRGDGDSPTAAAGDDVFAVRHITPLVRNLGALGVNAMSVPPARTALRTAIRTDRPAATAGFTLTQDGPGPAPAGMVVYQAVYRGQPRTVEERDAAAFGAVFVTLRLDQALDGVIDQIPRYLTLCVVDNDPAALRRRLFGPAGCETADAGLLHVRPLSFASRQWDLRVTADPLALPGADSSNAGPFAAVGMLAAAMLSALLLTVTGRARRIEIAVRERTAALTEQVREREHAEAALRSSEQRFRNIFNNVPTGICYTDLAGNVKQANPRFCQLVGYGAEELATLTAAHFTHPDDLAQDRELLAQLVRGEVAVQRRNKRYVDRRNRVVWVQATYSLLRNEDGAPWRMVAAVEDITEHLRLAEVERAREAAEASNRAKSDFLSRMSHELRTPLNAMLGFAQLLALDRQHPIHTAQRPWVEQIQHAGWHLLEMINDVLDLSRIDSGNLRLTIETLDVAQALASAATMVERPVRERHLALTQAVAPDAAHVRGDATRVKQILINLLSNAAKYNVDGGRIHLATHAAGAAVEIRVTDTGLGMTPEQLAELFQPFNRLGRERSMQEGTGIGLVISKRLAELMGGSLHATSSAGAGSSFVLTLPAPSEPQAPCSAAAPRSDPAAEYHRRLVHYVEDNETNVEVMRGILAQRPQVQLEVSVTGLDGLAAIRSRRPDVILLDMHLPDIDGLDLLYHLKQDPTTADIPVVVVSADAMQSQIDAALAAGAVRYLTKPVSVADLLAVTDELLDAADTRFEM